jgi:DeoR/GlpR family transcriptional regulator of sugar metabolism
MNQAERHLAIINHLDSTGACSYQEMAALFGVSEMTIRRDVDKLVQGGGLIKTLGGAQTAHAPKHLYESAVQQRLPIHRREKEQIAVEALRQIKAQQTVFLDGSTTCLVLARHLAREPGGVTAVTHSGLVCMEFGPNSGHAVVSVGGQFDPGSACFVGPTAEEAARRFFIDIAFLSTKGFLPDEGTFESSLATFRIKQIIAEQASRVVLLVDHSKFGQRALCKVLDIEQIDEVITDAGTSPIDVARLAERGVVVRIASEKHPAQETPCHAS